MTQLTDAQAVILSTACAREDGKLFPITANFKGGAVGNQCRACAEGPPRSRATAGTGCPVRR